MRSWTFNFCLLLCCSMLLVARCAHAQSGFDDGFDDYYDYDDGGDDYDYDDGGDDYYYDDGGDDGGDTSSSSSASSSSSSSSGTDTQSEGDGSLNDPDVFPNEADVKAAKWAQEQLAKFDDRLTEIRKILARDFVKGGKYWKEEGSKAYYDKHPWTKDSGLRDPGDSLDDWANDSLGAVGFSEMGSTGGITTGVGSPGDDFQTFVDCFEPRLVSAMCEYCQPPSFSNDDQCENYVNNAGFVWEYWWPENEIDLNNFAVAALNPLHPFERCELLPSVLRSNLEKFFRESDMKSYLQNKFKTPQPLDSTKYKSKGQSHSDGPLPVDQDITLEAHVYRTQVQHEASQKRCKGECGVEDSASIGYGSYCVSTDEFWYNGYKKGAPDTCFFDTLDPEVPDSDVINGWTEEIASSGSDTGTGTVTAGSITINAGSTADTGSGSGSGNRFMPIWRIPEQSQLLRSELYQISVPNLTLKDIKDGKGAEYLFKETCASYRSSKWPQLYGDLKTAVGIQPNSSDALGQICYRGGGDLYPVTGTIRNVQNPLVATAYLARRALEIMGSKNLSIAEKRRVLRFADREGPSQMGTIDSVDKLQRVFPREGLMGSAGKCFRMNEIDERNEDLFPPDLVTPDHLGSVRYVHWNRRRVCTCQYRGTRAAEENDPGEDSMGMDKGWGCQLYPDQDEEARGDIYDDEIQGGDPAGMAALSCTFNGFGAGFAEAASMVYPFFSGSSYSGSSSDSSSDSSSSDSGLGADAQAQCQAAISSYQSSSSSGDDSSDSSTGLCQPDDQGGDDGGSSSNEGDNSTDFGFSRRSSSSLN